MTFAFVQKSAALAFGDAVTSFSTSRTGVTAGNLAVVTASNQTSDATNPALPVATPTGWTVGMANNGAPLGANPTYKDSAAVFYKASSAGGTETATWSSLPTDTYIAASIEEFSYSGTCSVDVTGHNEIAGNVGATSNTVGPITSTASSGLIVGVNGGGVGLSTPTTGYTALFIEPDANVHTPHSSGYKILSASGSQTMVFPGTGSDTWAGWAGAVVIFKDSGGGGPTATTATAAVGVATVSGAGASSAKTAGTAAAGTATVSAVASASAVTTATAAAGVATVSAVGAGVNGTAAVAATGTSTVSATAAATSRTLGQADGLATVSGAGASLAATAGSAAGLATVSGSGAATAATTATPAVGAATVSGVGSSVAAGQTTAIPADGAATVSAQASSIVATTAVPAAGSAFVSATTPSLSGGGDAWGKKKRRQQVQAEVNRLNLEIIKAELAEEAKAESVVEAIGDEYDDDEDVLMLLL